MCEEKGGIIIKTITEAVLSLIDIGYTQTSALTEFDKLSKMKSVDYALSTIEKMENDFYISDYKDSIFYGNDGRYHIFINDNTGKRMHFTAKEKANLENKIKKHIKKNTCKKQSVVCCLGDIYKDFIRYKEIDASLATANKLNWAYKRYVAGSRIETLDISEITVIDLKEFCLEQISKYSLTDKGYKELKGLLNSLFGYAVDLGVISCNIAKQMSKVNSKKLRKACPSYQTQVFTKQEEMQLYEVAYKMFEDTKNTAYLAIILSGCLGLRVGELVALKKDDFDFKDMVVYIRRQEVRSYEKTESGRYKRTGYSVVDYLKTDESVRALPMSEPVVKIYDMLVNYNKTLNPSSEYLLLSKVSKERMSQSSYAGALHRANKNAGFIQRSNHKLRKTLLSELDHSVGRTYTRAYAGHSHNSVTLEKNYLYPTSPLLSQLSTVNDLVSERVPLALKSEQK